MIRDHSGLTNTSQTCLCCMCRCGDHKCFQQLALKLPKWMQNELKFDKDQKKRRKECSHESDLYRKTTYKRDFCEQQDIIDPLPLEHKKPVENLRPFSQYGYAIKDSMYRDDFVPWSKDEQDLYRAKLHVPPDQVPNRNAADSGSGDTLNLTNKNQFYSYYCPSHCVGDETPQVLENCLIGHEDRFNLGPPAKKAILMSEKSQHPFAKFSNYMLDYKGGKISPENRLAKSAVDISKPPCPMSSETSYRNEFPCPLQIDNGPAKKEGQADTLRVGEGPMIQQTTSMLDYKDPEVAIHRTARPPREVYRPPTCRMESMTTTGSSYPRWKAFSREEKPIKEKDLNSCRQPDRDVRRLVTTYQEDFDGLNSALCLCRVVEKYGPKVLEPRYNYTESEKLHDIFRFRKSSGPKNKDCPH